MAVKLTCRIMESAKKDIPVTSLSKSLKALLIANFKILNKKKETGGIEAFTLEILTLV